MSKRDGTLPKLTHRGLLRAVTVDPERMCFVHDWTRDGSLSHAMRYGYSAAAGDGGTIDDRTMQACAATAMDTLQTLVEMPARKRERFIRAIRAEMRRKTGDPARRVE